MAICPDPQLAIKLYEELLHATDSFELLGERTLSQVVYLNGAILGCGTGKVEIDLIDDQEFYWLLQKLPSFDEFATYLLIPSHEDS